MLGGLKLSLTRREKPIRNHIQSADIKHWAKHWNVGPEEIRAAIEKVGNSVVAVQKQLGQCGLIDPEPNEPPPTISQPTEVDR